MKSLLLAFIIVFALSLGAPSLHICYVKPSNSSSCPGQPCHTLDDYASKESSFTTGATFIFLAGRHGIHSTVLLHNTSNITMRGTSSGVILSCMVKSTVLLLCRNVTKLIIQNMTIQLCTGSMPENNMSTINFFASRDVWFMNLIFKGSSDLTKSHVGAVYSNHSDVSITSCLFENSTGDGGALFLSNRTNLILDGNFFAGNKAKNLGGAIFAEDSYLLLKETLGNTFTQNSAVCGGAMFCSNSVIEIVADHNIPSIICYTGETASSNCINFSIDGPISSVHTHTAIFSKNKARFRGGAIWLGNSTASLNGTAIIFQNNLAGLGCKQGKGGALYAELSNITSSIKALYFTGNRACSLHVEENENTTHYIECYGGAIYLVTCCVQLMGRIIFKNNHAVGRQGIGGAITAGFNTTMIIGGAAANFIDNSADFGGGVAIFKSELLLTAEEINFMNNSATSTAGGLGTKLSELSAKQINFVDNSAPEGGGIYSEASNCSLMTANFLNNSGSKLGGAIVMTTVSVYFHDINITGNSGTAINIFNSTANFSGDIKICKNIGGGMKTQLATVYFTGITIFEENYFSQQRNAI